MTNPSSESGSGEARLVSLLRQRISNDSSVLLGIGDDAAVVQLSPGQQLVACTDTLVDGVHFPGEAMGGTDPAAIGHKALAVNLSDLAAMGATPRWALLSLTIPQSQSNPEKFLNRLLDGFLPLAKRHGVCLIGGDLSAGPLSVTVQCLGEARAGEVLCRGGASEDELIAISGRLGGAARVLEQIKSGSTFTVEERRPLDFPEPRVALGQQLKGVATSAIDVSDGLLLDLERLLDGSGLGADIQQEKLPLARSLTNLSSQDALQLALNGGDDYELLFTFRAEDLARITTEPLAVETDVTVVGRVSRQPGVRLVDSSGETVSIAVSGFDHFSAGGSRGC